MNKKVLIGIIAGVVAVAVAVGCFLILGGDKLQEKRDEVIDELVDEVVDGHYIMVDGEAVNPNGAITQNARNKTCLANQREIQSQFNNAYMSGMIDFQPGDVYELRTNEDGTDYEWVCINAQEDQSAIFDSLFQNTPYCLVGGNVIRITIAEGAYDGISIEVECIGDVECHE